ncbi:hypothetical protein J6W91_00085 [Candidatus Saccharibacteria bacterium]|nr:hypothetical protein [Candidatus Saccharibacteria bacterium]
MGNPRTLKVSLDEYGYYMELDTAKQYCAQEAPHWHLCKNGRRIGQISYDGYWTTYPSTDASSSIIKEAERLTSQYRSEIIEYYNYNKENGADY